MKVMAQKSEQNHHQIPHLELHLQLVGQYSTRTVKHQISKLPQMAPVPTTMMVMMMMVMMMMVVIVNVDFQILIKQLFELSAIGSIEIFILL